MNTYTAVVTREGREWLAEVPGLDGAHAFAGTLGALRRELVDAVILSAELPDDAEPDIRLSITEPDSPEMTVMQQALELAQQVQELTHLQQALRLNMRDTAVELSTQGWSVRDIAGALGRSAGWVSQVLDPQRGAKASGAVPAPRAKAAPNATRKPAGAVTTRKAKVAVPKAVVSKRGARAATVTAKSSRVSAAASTARRRTSR